MTALIDTSVLLAYAFSRDSNHEAAREALASIALDRQIVPVPVLSELFYMTMVRVSYSRAVQLFATVRAAFEIIELIDADLARMQAIMEQYLDTKFDFTDTALMALSERMGITQVYTFDRRDFSIFRPRHCDYLELLP